MLASSKDCGDPRSTTGDHRMRLRLSVDPISSHLIIFLLSSSSRSLLTSSLSKRIADDCDDNNTLIASLPDRPPRSLLIQRRLAIFLPSENAPLDSCYNSCFPPCTGISKLDSSRSQPVRYPDGVMIQMQRSLSLPGPAHASPRWFILHLPSSSCNLSAIYACESKCNRY